MGPLGPFFMIESLAMGNLLRVSLEQSAGETLVNMGDLR